MIATVDRQLSRAVAMRSPRVMLAGGLSAHCAPGGGEVQLRALAAWLPRVGASARLWRPWEHAWEEFDVLHLVGSATEFVSLAAAARRSGKYVALSPVTWFRCRDLWREPWTVARRTWASTKFLARAVCPSIPSWRRRLYQSADLLLPNSQAEADQLRRYFGVPQSRLRVVPNGADPELASATPDLFRECVRGGDFVLCVGRIEPRKNQLGLITALRGTGLPVVLVGDVVPGHESYLAACRRAAGADVLFVGHLPQGDPLLASAYAACRCFALVSWYETPGLAALEAAMSGTPLVLTRDGACQEYFGRHATYVSPDDHRAIRSAVISACQSERSPSLARHVLSRYSWAVAARATKEAYETLL